ncbi:MAG: hypothetical protein ACYTBZ_24365 [Planctomycetota bacterium]|jgi:hypothetical protein
MDLPECEYRFIFCWKGMVSGVGCSACNGSAATGGGWIECDMLLCMELCPEDWR